MVRLGPCKKLMQNKYCQETSKGEFIILPRLPLCSMAHCLLTQQPAASVEVEVYAVEAIFALTLSFSWLATAVSCRQVGKQARTALVPCLL